ncbi:hypothetical protein [Fibrisoma limi]|uniref:hypothetical protein n=1 Tax=Fibrisoma limi TaxID=663275 RepID=UPI000587173E|nr:hypothetical protein [Fibrisoma limi]
MKNFFDVMNSCFKNLSIIGFILLNAACQEELLQQLTPPGNRPASLEDTNKCQAPPIVQNIIGEWKFFTLDAIGRSKTGTLAFDQNQTFTDSDTLFSVSLPDGYEKRIYLKWSVETDEFGEYKPYGEMVWLRLYAKNQSGVTEYVQGNFFQVAINECKRIELIRPNDKFKLVLFR